MMSELGRETVSAYAAAKGGLKMLTRNICSEYGEYNIQCNGLGPGYIATPQTAPLRERQADGSRHPFDSFICAKTPAGRWLEPEELAGPAVFLASDASNAVNGHILYVDGGILAYIGKHQKIGILHLIFNNFITFLLFLFELSQEKAIFVNEFNLETTILFI